MTRSLPPYEQLVEEDYIDMDITLCSPPHQREFEFQMSSHPFETEPLPSPADELFYKGKLLPLHLPPRLQMVRKLLQNSGITPRREFEPPVDQNSTTTTTTAATTPFESCNVSPATSCYVSGELDPEDYYYEYPAGIVRSNPKKSWSKKLKLIGQSSLGLKLKASRAYLRSLFTKSGCSDESCAVPRASGRGSRFMKPGKKNPFGQIQRESYVDRGKMTEDDCGHRRSFSGAIKRHSRNKSSSASSSSCSSSNSSSFSSVNSNGSYGQQVLKRSSSVNSEVESSIQGAIAYCKRSQQLVCGRKSVSDVGLCSLSAAKIAAECEKQERGLEFAGDDGWNRAARTECAGPGFILRI